jgi:hypothetical protein
MYTNIYFMKPKIITLALIMMLFTTAGFAQRGFHGGFHGGFRGGYGFAPHPVVRGYVGYGHRPYFTGPGVGVYGAVPYYAPQPYYAPIPAVGYYHPYIAPRIAFRGGGYRGGYGFRGGFGGRGGFRR